MPITTITPQYVNPPKDGKRASIKTGDGQFYGFKDAKYGGKTTFNDFTAGQSYEVEYATRDYNGKEYRDIVAIVGDKKNGAFNERPRISQTISPPSDFNRRTHPIDAENMWVNNLMAACIGTGQIQINAESLEILEREVRLAHKNAYQPPKSRDDFNDEIPEFGK